MSEKYIELLTKVGFEAEKLANPEELNADELLNEYKSKQRDLLKNDPDFMNPLKEEIKTGYEIVATKKSKKALNEKFGLGLSTKELDETDYPALLDLASEKTKTGATAEVNTLQEQLMGLTNKLKETEEAAENKVKEIEKNWQEKFESGAREKLLLTEIAEIEQEKGITISPEMALKVVRLGMQDAKYSIKFEGDSHDVYEGEYKALTSDRTNKLTVKGMVRTLLNDFIKKSNGAPQGDQRRSTEPEKITPMSTRAQEMREKFGVTA